MDTEYRYTTEAAAHTTRRQLIDQGATVSMIAHDPARDLYVFNASKPRRATSSANRPDWTVAYRPTAAQPFAIRLADVELTWVAARALAGEVRTVLGDEAQIWYTSTARAEVTGRCCDTDRGWVYDEDTDARIPVADCGRLADLGIDLTDPEVDQRMGETIEAWYADAN